MVLRLGRVRMGSFDLRLRTNVVVAADQPVEDLTAKQRLALSRQALALAVHEPVWADLLRVVIRRCVKRQDLKRDQIR